MPPYASMKHRRETLNDGSRETLNPAIQYSKGSSMQPGEPITVRYVVQAQVDTSDMLNRTDVV
jgi:hypothetical protein